MINDVRSPLSKGDRGLEVPKRAGPVAESGRNSAGPDRILRPPQLCKLRRAQRRLACGEEFVELRRVDLGRAQHRVRLTPMMNLMLKQMKQQPVDPLALNAITAVYVNDTIEIGGA